MRHLIALLIAVFFIGCATTRDEARPVQRAKTPKELQVLGYTRVEATGTWKYGFERSEFVPNDRPNEKWWLKLPSRWWDENKNPALRRKGIEQNGVSIRINGLLSPKGQWGHLGEYDHEFVADSISSLDPGPAIR
jgi:hypothetical protein